MNISFEEIDVLLDWYNATIIEIPSCSQQWTKRLASIFSASLSTLNFSKIPTPFLSFRRAINSTAKEKTIERSKTRDGARKTDKKYFALFT